MMNRRASLGILVALLLVAVLAAAVLGAGPALKWQLIGSGGGPASGPENGFASAVGQPVSGRVSNGYTIYGGLYFSSGAPGPAGYKVMLPSLVK